MTKWNNATSTLLMVVINGQKADLTKSIYFMGLVQFLAIMGGVLAIVTLMLK